MNTTSKYSKTLIMYIENLTIFLFVEGVDLLLSLDHLKLFVNLCFSLHHLISYIISLEIKKYDSFSPCKL